MLPNNRITAHPGELLAGILSEQKLSQAQFARDIGVPEECVSDAMAGTADLARGFAKAFSQTQQFWLNLQAMHDRSRANVEAGGR